ncbi:MAG TPA: alpha/beta fold hydrolase [Terrimicrobiaceae bacterium]|nr:alpha/beta fold hydrolase [Terrimicrobiaceae bacterium]
MLLIGVSPMKMSRWFVALLAAFALVGCGSYSTIKERRPLFRASAGTTGPDGGEATILRALRFDRSRPLVALGDYLSVIETASERLAQHPKDERALRDYNFALARVFTTIRSARLDPWTQPLTVPGDHGGFVLTHRPDPRARWNPALYEFTPTDQFDVHGSYVSERTIREGVGAPLVAIGRDVYREARAEFTLPRVYYGVTAVARFEGKRCIISFEDPLAVETVRLNGRTFPLGADFTVPVAVMLAKNNPKKFELTRLLRPDKYAETARIARLQPYDPNKAVVLVVHGLMDTPATWTPMINTLRGDEEIRRNYQFWFFSYPSGYPYPYSAAILRHELDAVNQKFHIRKPMVVIGHSMGGCISRLLITDTGDKLWMELFGKPPEQVNLKPETKKLFAEALIFSHRPEVGRVIFISAPLRGSDLAVHSIGRLGSSLVRLPVTLLGAGRDALKIMTFTAGDLRLRRLPNSVDTLAPTNRFVRAINTIPITKGIPYHSIMGDRGRGDTPNSSDGVVPYSSSHLDGAQSELIVPSAHNAHQNQQAIEEVRRILKLDVRATAGDKRHAQSPSQ